MIARNKKSQFWKVINYWNDNELFNFLNKQNNDFIKEFCNYIVLPYVTWPVVNYRVYYQLYYPKTWIIINKIATSPAGENVK